MAPNSPTPGFPRDPARPDFAQLSAWAEEEVRFCREHLPEAVRPAAEGLPVTYRRRASRAICEEGFPEDLLGLFVGPSLAEGEGGGGPLPAQVLLFLESIWRFALRRERLYRREVRKTYLHELGHYLGWSEEDLYQRGLD